MRRLARHDGASTRFPRSSRLSSGGRAACHSCVGTPEIRAAIFRTSVKATTPFYMHPPSRGVRELASKPQPHSRAYEWSSADAQPLGSRRFPRPRAAAAKRAVNIAGTATIVDTMPPTTTQGTYPIARNPTGYRAPRAAPTPSPVTPTNHRAPRAIRRWSNYDCGGGSQKPLPSEHGGTSGCSNNESTWSSVAGLSWSDGEQVPRLWNALELVLAPILELDSRAGD